MGRASAPLARRGAVRLALVEDHGLVREGLRLLLEREEGFEVVGEGKDGGDAVRLAAELQPDVLLLEPFAPGRDGIEAVREIAGRGGPTRVLALTRLAGEETAVRLLRAGAAGYLPKTTTAADLAAAVREVHAGGIYLPAGFHGVLIARCMHPGDRGEETLSDREFQVLVQLAGGAVNREIAARLGIGVKTVDTHRSNLLRKLGLRNNSDLTRFALRRGLIEG